jgi:hypothetical protein
MKPAAVITAVVLAFLTAAFASTCAVAQEGSDTGDDPLKERLGVRVGYARTQNRLSDAYGAGLNLALHFTQRIRKPFSIDVTVGAIYLGSTDKDIQFPDFDTAWFDDVSMRILMLTAAPMVEVEVSDRTSYYFSVGAGLYSATLILDQALTELDLTKNYFGINANVGATRRIFTNWFLDLNLHVHRFWTPDDPRSVDWIYLFSDGDSDPLFWTITGGVGLRLF